MAGMAADPVPFDLVLGERRREPLPEVLVFHRLAAGGFPAVGAPAMDPARDAVPQIDAVRVDADLARALQRLQPADRRHQPPAVVGRPRPTAVPPLPPPPTSPDPPPPP